MKQTIVCPGCQKQFVEGACNLSDEPMHPDVKKVLDDIKEWIEAMTDEELDKRVEGYRS